jgi:transcriptional regulator with XRE-family HTH domain
MGTTRQTIIRWEKGYYSPNAESRRKLAAATGQKQVFFADSHAPDDDEEGDPVADLIKAIQVLVRTEVHDHLGDVRRAVN